MIRKLMLMLLALAMTTACAAADTITDMHGRTIDLAEPVTRVVALTAADCEILCALGAQDTLVGRGEYCNYPADILDRPVVQSGANTNVEEILALQPQVLLMNDMAQNPEQIEQLERSGVRVVVSDATDIEGVYTAIRMIGQLTGRDAQAEALVADMQAAFADIAARCGQTGMTVYFEVSPLQYGLWTAGSGTFMDELAGICGLTNAFADVQGWAQISEEQVLARDPDIIVTNAMAWGDGPTPVEEIMSRQGWQGLKAVQSGSVLSADPDMISRPGPRLVDAAWQLYQFITGEAEEVPAA